MIIGIDDLSIFKVFFEVVYEDTEVVELACNSTGMKVSILDKSHTCFYEVFYDATFFDLFDVNESEEIILDLDDLVKILKKTHKDDYLTLSNDENRVIAKFEHEGNRRVFELVQSVDFMESPVPPEIPVNCSVIIPIDDLVQSLNDFDVFKAGSCHLTCGDKFIISSNDDASMNYTHEVDAETDGSGDAYYSVEYLKKITKFKKIDGNVKLEFGDTLPLVWTVENNWVCVKGLVAPRIETE